MTEPIKRVYVCQSKEVRGSEHLTSDLDSANRYAKHMPGAVMRVFTEEVPWILAPPPDHRREVLVLYRKHDMLQQVRVIVGCYGSEGKWLAYDHDRRTTYLDDAAVLGWRELPEVPEQFARAKTP